MSPIIQLQNLSLFVSKNDCSLLEILEAHGISIEFQCRAGYCGVCRLHLLSGTIKYKQKPLALIRYGEILPCCCSLINDIKLKL